MTRRRHRNPWRVEVVAADRLAAGDRVAVDGFDYVVAAIEPDGLALAPDGGALSVRLELAHPTGRRGRPRSFPAPAPATLDRLVAVQRIAGAADWRGF